MSGKLLSLNWQEKSSVATIACIYSLRMLGLFMIIPIFATYARDNLVADQYLVGLAIGSYGLTQALLQIPCGVLSDRYGRKPIIVVGLLLFAIGSIVAGMSSTIYGIILGRTLQGAGAIGSVLMATMADLTRAHVRSRAMAYLGASIGLSFMLAMVLGPLLNKSIGVNGIFTITALLATLGIILTFIFIPKSVLDVELDIPSMPDVTDNNEVNEKNNKTWKTTIKNIINLVFTFKLSKLYFGVFALHAILSALFLVLPLMLSNAGFQSTKLWQLYLFVLLAAFTITMMTISWMEKNKKIVFCHNLSILMLLFSFGILFYYGHEAIALVIGMIIFFIGFCILEASLPAQVSKNIPAYARGTALGIYSSSQFLGIFLGGVIGGLLHASFGMTMVLVLCMLLSVLWFCLQFTQRILKWGWFSASY